MYKEIFRWVIAIISQPAKAWVLLAKKGEKQEEFLSRFVYPLIGFVTVAAFLGVLFTRKEFDLELALKSSIRTLVSSFGGFYLGAYLMNEIWQGIFKREKDLKLWLRFVGYSSPSLMFAFEYRIDVASRVFLLADIYPLYILYCLGRRWSVYGSRGEDPSEVRRIYNRHYITDSGSYRDFVIDADARFEFLTE